MVEEQIDPEILAAHLQRVLASDEGETYAEFEEKLPQVFQKPGDLSNKLLDKSGVSIFFGDISGLPRTVLWDRRFRLSTSHVLPKKAPALSSGSQRGHEAGRAQRCFISGSKSGDGPSHGISLSKRRDGLRGVAGS